MPKKKPKNAEEAYQIQRVPVSSVKENPNNPRVILDDDFMNLVESIKKDGFMLAIRFIVVDSNGVVVGGNQRFKACKAAGLKEVYVVRAEDLNEKQLKEFVFKDNTHFGEWDKQMLSHNYSDKEMVQIGMNLMEVATPRLETIGDIEPEIDVSDLAKKKEAYENSQVKQIVVYFPAEIYEKVIKSMNVIKEHMQINENPEVLLKLISHWKINHAT